MQLQPYRPITQANTTAKRLGVCFTEVCIVVAEFSFPLFGVCIWRNACLLKTFDDPGIWWHELAYLTVTALPTSLTFSGYGHFGFNDEILMMRSQDRLVWYMKLSNKYTVIFGEA